MDIVLYFEENKKLSDIILSIDSFLIDIFVMIAIITWIIKPDSHCIFATGTFYIIRSIGMNLSRFPR